MKTSDLIAQYVESLSVGRSQRTQSAYRWALVATLKDLTDKPASQLTPERITASALANLKSREPSTVRNYLSALSDFVHWALSNKHVKMTGQAREQLADNIHRMRPKSSRLPKTVMPDLIDQLIDAARAVPALGVGTPHVIERHELIRLRDVAILLFVKSSGVRVGELAGLKRGDVEMDTRTATVTGKENKQRKVFFDEPTHAAITAYLEARKDGKENRLIYLYPLFAAHCQSSSSKLHALTTKSVERIFADLLERAEIGKAITPHTLRHNFATRVLTATSDLAAVQDLLGHASPETTRIYAGTNCYVTMWNNRTYTGAIKCGDELFPNAHPAYISVEDFERVQARKRPTPGNAPGTLTGDPFNSRRIHSPMLLSGLLYCGLCGAAMVAHYSKGYGYYKCGRKQRHGDCAQRLIAAWYVEDTLIDWMCDNAITRAKIASLRDAINRELNGDRTDLEGRKTRIEAERRDAEKEITRLVNLAARVGDVDELEQGIRERQRRARELKRDADAIAERLTQKPVEVTDAQIDYLTENIKGILKDGEAEDVKEVLRGTVARAEVGADTLTIDYVPPLVVFKQMPPRGGVLKHNLPVEYIERAIVALPRLLRLPSAA